MKNRTIDCNLKSVTSVDGWISPLDSMHSWAPYLHQLGFVDDAGRDEIVAAVKKSHELFDSGAFVNSTLAWGQAEVVIVEKTGQIDFYNVIRPQKMPGSKKYFLKPDVDVNGKLLTYFW